MATIPTNKIKQPHVEQMHDNIDWITTKLNEAKALTLLSEDKLMRDLLQDIQADVDHLKGSLPPRQLAFDF